MLLLSAAAFAQSVVFNIDRVKGIDEVILLPVPIMVQRMDKPGEKPDVVFDIEVDRAVFKRLNALWSTRYASELDRAYLETPAMMLASWQAGAMASHTDGLKAMASAIQASKDAIATMTAYREAMFKSIEEFNAESGHDVDGYVKIDVRDMVAATPNGEAHTFVTCLEIVDSAVSGTQSAILACRSSTNSGLNAATFAKMTLGAAVDVRVNNGEDVVAGGAPTPDESFGVREAVRKAIEDVIGEVEQRYEKKGIPFGKDAGAEAVDVFVE